MTRAMLHFLLIYDHALGELVREETFTRADTAADAYIKAEQEYRDKKDLEIVLVGADSLGTIRVTHANYFSGSPLASKYLSLT